MNDKVYAVRLAESLGISTPILIKIIDKLKIKKNRTKFRSIYLNNEDVKIIKCYVKEKYKKNIDTTYDFDENLVDLRSELSLFVEQDLKDFCNEYNFNYETILRMKKGLMKGTIKIKYLLDDYLKNI